MTVRVRVRSGRREREERERRERERGSEGDSSSLLLDSHLQNRPAATFPSLQRRNQESVRKGEPGPRGAVVVDCCARYVAAFCPPAGGARAGNVGEWELFHPAELRALTAAR